MIEQWIFGVYAIGVLLLIGFYVLGRKRTRAVRSSETSKSNPLTGLTYEELFDIIDTTFKRESVELLKEYRLHNVIVINDMERDLRSLTQKTIKAMSTELFDAVSLYHDKDYVIHYITRMSRDLLLEYTDKHKPKTTRTLS